MSGPVSIEGGKTVPGTKSKPVSSYINTDMPFIVRAIHCNVGGTVNGYLQEDIISEAARPFVMVAGRDYSYSFKKITSVAGGFTGNLIG